jgi:CRISPR-associated protein Cas2
MLVLITYDVNTETKAGRKRLRQVAKTCEDYGHRVQNSVFECEVDSALLLKIKNRLLNLIDMETDSLRFYTISEKNRDKTEHFGVKPSLDIN